MNAHRTTNKLLAAFALGELGREESSEVEAHVTDCARCRDELGRLQTVLACADRMGKPSADEGDRTLAKQALSAAVAGGGPAGAGAQRARPGRLIGRTIMNSRAARLAAAAILVLIGIGVLRMATDDHGGVAVAAEILAQIDEAEAITWKTTYYNYVTSADGERTWLSTEEREVAYKAPGLYHEVALDDDMQIRSIWIVDAVNAVELSLNPAARTATLSEVAVVLRSPRGPFVWVEEKMKGGDLQFVGKATTPAGEADVYRTAFWDERNGNAWSYDFWLDARTRRLVALWVPGANIFDPDSDPARDTPPEEHWGMVTTSAGTICHDIDFGAELDDSLFRLEAPEGYEVTFRERPTVTEEEMIEYLGVLADFNDRTFPDSPYGFPAYRANQIWDKPEEDRAPAEQKLLDTSNRYIIRGLNSMPTRHFISDHTEEGSFHYVGKGVELDDEKSVVCWYKLRDTGTYRAVYGDLSVKDVNPEDLPLGVDASTEDE